MISWSPRWPNPLMKRNNRISLLDLEIIKLDNGKIVYPIGTERAHILVDC